MGTNVVQEFAGVHDNEIVAYHVDITNRVLKLETVYLNKEKTEIIFSGLMAHQFENVIYSNIILGITQTTIDYYIKANEDFLRQSIRYAFPAFFKSVDDLHQHMQENNYNVYEISSSLGLCGTVIAKEIAINIVEIG